jgi:hypothetical protein
MPRGKATDGLSEAGQAAMCRGFAAGWTAARIAQAVKDATGETVAERTVARRAAEWRMEMADRKARREHVADLVAAMREQGMDGAEMIQALACDQLMEHPEQLTGADPIELHGLQLDAEKVRQKKREMDIRERVVAIDERKIALLEEREKRAIAALTKDGVEAMTPEERIAEIREIYGIRTQAV